MLAGIHPERVPGSSRVLEFTSGEPLPLFEDGDGFQTPTIVDSPMVLETMAIPSNGSGSLTNTVNPCYLTSSWEDTSVFSPFMGAEHVGTEELDMVLRSVGSELADDAFSPFMGACHAETDELDAVLGSVGGESVNDAQLASEINEFIDRLITQGERSTKRFSGLPAIPSSLPFAAQETSATAPKSLVLGGDEQQQQQHEQQQQERRARRQRQQGAHVCSRTDCGKRFERSNALLRHIASIHNCKGVLCPFCVSKKKRFNRSDNFTRHVTTAHSSISGDDERLLGSLSELYHGTGRRTLRKRSL